MNKGKYGNPLNISYFDFILSKVILYGLTAGHWHLLLGGSSGRRNGADHSQTILHLHV